MHPSHWSFNPRDWQRPQVFFVDAIEDAGLEGQTALRVAAKSPDWNNILTREFVLEPETERVIFRGWARYGGVVAGAAPYMSARAQLRFLDEEGVQVGPWPEGELFSGTQDWHYFSQTHQVPAGASSVEIMLGLVNCSGEVQYAALELVPEDAEKNALPLRTLPESVTTDTSGWFPFPGSAKRADKDMALSVGAILGFADKPDFHRISTNQSGRFVSPNGKIARFWGTNLGPPRTWPSEAEAITLAERFSRAGINLVRFHHLDRGWHPDNIFEAGANHTQSFDAKKRARMDFLIYQLRQRGIHIFFDLLVTRRFREADEVPHYKELPLGAKIVAHFDPRIIELQKDYARQLLGHRNPHTGLTYAEDPAVAMVSIINESSLFLDGSLSVSVKSLPVYYRDQLDARFREWAAAQAITVSPEPLAKQIRRRVPVVADFLEALQNEYYADMKQFLRDEVGLQAPLAGSNFQETAADARSNARFDFFDVHGYWSHPVGGWSPTDSVPAQPLIRALGGASPLRGWAAKNFAGLPMVISEWQAAWPNPTAYQMPLIVAAVASRQDWDGAVWFGLQEPDWSARMDGTFDSGNKPHFMPGFTLGALLFLRGDIPVAPTQPIPFSYENGFAGFSRAIDSISLLEHRIVRTPPHTSPTQPEAGKAHSSPLTWIDERILQFNTARSVGVLGLFEAGESFTPGGHRILLKNSQAAQILFSSLNRKTIETSGDLLLLASANAENTGQVYRARRAGLREIGKAPILIEPVHAELTIQTAYPKREWHLQPLDWDGFPLGKPRTLTSSPEGRLMLDTTQDPVPWWRLRLIEANQSPLFE